MQTAKKESLLRKPGVQTLLASLICIVLGLLVGYIALLIINPAGATETILAVIKNFWAYSKPEKQLKYFGATLVTTAPLLMCSWPGPGPACSARWRCTCPGTCA